MPTTSHYAKKIFLFLNIYFVLKFLLNLAPTFDCLNRHWNNNLFILFYMELREQSVNPEIVETDQILENGQEVQNVNEEVNKFII